VNLTFPDFHAGGLVDVNFVRLVRRVDAEAVAAMVDCGKIIWAWDISIRGRSRTRVWRFWLNEICTPQMTARLTVDEVLDRILPPSRTWYWAKEVGQLLLLARNTIAALARQLGATMKNRSFQFSRARLVAWLRERWVGGINS